MTTLVAWEQSKSRFCKHQTGMYKQPKNNGPEIICCKGLEVVQVHHIKMVEF